VTPFKKLRARGKLLCPIVFGKVLCFEQHFALGQEEFALLAQHRDRLEAELERFFGVGDCGFQGRGGLPGCGDCVVEVGLVGLSRGCEDCGWGELTRALCLKLAVLDSSFVDMVGGRMV
jgi:hypothetical protein